MEILLSRHPRRPSERVALELASGYTYQDGGTEKEGTTAIED